MASEKLAWDKINLIQRSNLIWLGIVFKVLSQASFVIFLIFFVLIFFVLIFFVLIFFVLFVLLMVVLLLLSVIVGLACDHLGELLKIKAVFVVIMREDAGHDVFDKIFHLTGLDIKFFKVLKLFLGCLFELFFGYDSILIGIVVVELLLDLLFGKLVRLSHKADQNCPKCW